MKILNVDWSEKNGTFILWITIAFLKSNFIRSHVILKYIYPFTYYSYIYILEIKALLCKDKYAKNSPCIIIQSSKDHAAHGVLKIGKRVCQGHILSFYTFNLYAKYIMQNTGLDDSQLVSRWPGKISTTSNMQMIPS